MTDVALFKGDAQQQAVGQFRKLAGERAQSGKLFMKMTKAGKWVYGAEEVEVEPTERWAINPMSIKVGFIGWKGGQVVGEQMFPYLSGNRVDPDSLPPIISEKQSDGWREQKSVELKSLDDGVEAIYQASSVGGMNAFADLGEALAEQIEKDPAHPVPVVVLKNDSYKHKEYGTIYTPIIEIVEWRSMDAEAPEPERKKLV